MDARGSPSVGFSWEGPKLRAWPIVLVAVVGAGVVSIAFASSWASLRLLDAALIDRRWPILILAELFELLLSLLGISIAERYLPNAEFAVRWPPGRTLVGKALVWGLGFAAVMLAADHGGELIGGWAPDVPSRWSDIAGKLAFDLLLVGLCEETLFRGLLLGVLEALSPSRVRFRGSSIGTAGITISALFALAHAESFASEAWPLALAQQVYAFAIGLVYAWMRERSGSVLAPAVLHSVSDLVEDAVVFGLALLLPQPH